MCFLWGASRILEDHLFFTCKMSQALWSRFYGWLGISAVQPAVSSLHFLSHRGLFKWKNRKSRGLLIWLAVVWSIWLERNEIVFNNSKTDVLRLLDLVKCRSWSWLCSSTDGLVSFSEWCICPLECSIISTGLQVSGANWALWVLCWFLLCLRCMIFFLVIF